MRSSLCFLHKERAEGWLQLVLSTRQHHLKAHPGVASDSVYGEFCQCWPGYKFAFTCLYDLKKRTNTQKLSTQIVHYTFFLIFLKILPLTRTLNSYQINNSKEQVTSELTALVVFRSFEVVLKGWQCGELCGQLDGQRMSFRTWAVLRPSSCLRWFSTSGWRMRGRKGGCFFLLARILLPKLRLPVLSTCALLI